MGADQKVWKSSGNLRVGIGIVATVLLASTINRVVNPPEGLETNEVTAEEAPAIDPSPAVDSLSQPSMSKPISRTAPTA